MSVEDRLSAIEQRNEIVSRDKKWETSVTRRLFICIITYICACFIFKFILPSQNWYIGAIVPVCGYLLSTLSLPRIRRVWEKRLLP